MKRSTTCITFETPKHYLLQGVWLGTPSADTVFIFVHGLCSNLFAQSAVAEVIARERNTAVLLFNNRGNGYISKIKKRQGKKIVTHSIGGAHEIFTESRDDIAGAISCALREGAERIVLVGHSTGCQKSIYYLASHPDSKVVGAVLLAPLSDYAGIEECMSKSLYTNALNTARRFVLKSKPHELLPEDICPTPCDAQRWLSLYTSESIEEIFSYASGKSPRVLQKVSVPTLALFAKDDQYADRSAHEIATWFSEVRTKVPIATEIVDARDHGFTGCENQIARTILATTRLWLA